MYADIPKMAVQQLVSIAVSHQMRTFIVDHMDIDPDSKTLKVGTWCVGEVVSRKVRPYTDDAVDKTVSWIKSKRNKKNATTE